MDNRNNKDIERSQEENISPKADPETLHKTDPQDNMKGPVSSLMHDAGKAFETDETKEEADREKDEKM